MKNAINRILNVVLPWRLWSAYKRYIAKITTSGYSRPSSPILMALSKMVFGFWIWVQVGKVKKVNWHYVDTPGRVVFCGNHSSMLDAILAFPLMHRPVRSIGAYEPLRQFGGLPAIVLTRLGVVPVDRARGATVLKPAIDLVVEGDCMGLFPEGKISPTGELLPFKPGVALIANAAFNKLGGKESVAIVPIHICYGRRHAPSALNYRKMGLKWRGGVTVTALPPIFLQDLQSRDVKYVMSLVRAAIAGVDCATTSNGNGPVTSK